MVFSEPVRTIDLGCYLDQAAYPPWGYSVRHVSHAEGARAMANFLNDRELEGARGAVDPEDFPEDLGLAWSHVRMSDHTGNHIDAPYHFGPTCEGRPAKTIDEVPLSWCTGPGLRLDVRGCLGRDVELADIEAQLELIGEDIQPGTIPLLWTGSDVHLDDPEAYWQKQAGLSIAALHFLLDRGVKLIGIDAYAMDVSYETMKAGWTAEAPQFFPAHFVGREREHMHLEKLTRLGDLPRASGFHFCAFPMKLRGGSAGWVRPVALVPESHFSEA